MTDTSGEVERLIASTQELTTAAPRLLELTSQYGGPFLDRVQQIGQAWLASGRRDFYAPLFTLLKETHTLKDPQQILSNLAKYLDAIAAIIFTTPMFIENVHLGLLLR